MVTFFDCNVMIGPRTVPQIGSFSDIASLKKKMQQAGIEKAMVYHSLSREYDPMTGNRLLIEMLVAEKSLLPVWVVLPSLTGEFMEESKIPEELARNGVKAVRIFSGPADFNFAIHELVVGNLFKVLEANRIPVLIDYAAVNFDDIFNILTKHQTLKLVFTNVSHRIDRDLYPLLDRFTNFSIETSTYRVHRGIEAVVRRFGSRRLVFGSGLPTFSAGSAVTMITHADISDSDKKNIASKNMEILLGDGC
ncbi:MAG TPA: hypothetical protein DDW50_02755 [Firmicutes bacterium]|jgi:uncharacterized protein|nr:hypothetical protein [Bacillota bacterium]